MSESPMIRAAMSGVGGVPEDVAEMTLTEAAMQHPADPAVIDLPPGEWQPMTVEVLPEPLGQIVFDVTQTRADFLPTQGVHDGVHRTAEMI